MRKSLFKRFLAAMFEKDKHVAKRKGFAKMADNPAGSKFRKWCHPLSRRGADGTMRQQ